MISAEMATAAKQMVKLFPDIFNSGKHVDRVQKAVNILKLFDSFEINFFEAYVKATKMFQSLPEGLITVTRWATKVGQLCNDVEFIEMTQPGEVVVMLFMHS